MKTQYFSVKGFGFFPLDMLRYDSCFPDTQEDVEKIDNSNMEVSGRSRTVKLRRNIPRRIQPSIARWNSFGWGVDMDSIKIY